MEPFSEDRRVDGAEVRLDTEVATIECCRRHERGRAGEAATHVRAEHHERTTGTMIGAERRVLACAPAELGEHDRDDLLLDVREIRVEGGERLSEDRKLRILTCDLSAMRVERSPVDRDDAGPQARLE